MNNMEIEDINRYMPAMVAMEFLEKGNQKAAGGALEALVKTLDLGKDGEIVTDLLRKGPEGNKQFAGIFAGKYHEAMINSNPKELFQVYSKDFKEFLSEKAYTKAGEILGGYEGEKYGEILDKYNEAASIVSGKVNREVSDEEKKKAEAVVEKYAKVVTPIKGFEQIRKEAFSDPLDKGALKETLEEMFNPKPKENVTQGNGSENSERRAA